MDTLLQDLRYAARQLLRARGFTVIAVLTIALGVGATTATFSVVNGVLLNPLPFADPKGLVFIESVAPTGQSMPASPQDLVDYRDQSHSFVGIAGVSGGNAILIRTGQPAARVQEARVGATFFSLLGVRPEAGRFFAPGEDAASAPRVAVISDVAWRRYFGSDARIVGQVVDLDGQTYRIVGIAAPTMTLGGHPDVWIPAVWHDYEIGDANRGFHSIFGIGRLEKGVTAESGRRDLQAIAARLASAFPQHNAKIGAFVEPLERHLLGDVSRPLWAMLGAVAFVLLIACANVANLLLVRSMSRESEFAVRTALGASRGRVTRQLITESILLTLLGAVLGTILAAWTIDALVAFGPTGLPRLGEISIDGRVFGVTALVTVSTGLVFGLLPALHIGRTDLSQTLRSGSRGMSGHASRTRSTLALAETALAMVLLVGAGLLIRSFERLVHVDAGLRPDHLLVFDAALSGRKYEYDAGVIRFATDVATRLSGIPGIAKVAIAANRPIDPEPGFSGSAGFTIDEQPKPKHGNEPDARILPVSPNYFSTLETPLVRGRSFTEAENRLEAAPVMVINQALARRYFPNVDPIGQHLTFGLSHTITANPADTVRVRGEIIGITANVKHGALGEEVEPAVYVPYVTAPFSTTFLVRTTADPALVEAAIRRQVNGADPAVPIYELASMQDAMMASVAQPRFYTALLAAFAAIALLLAGLGIYGVISFLVGQRTREFGIRMALGATPSELARSVVGRGLAFGFAGIAIGAVLAVIGTRAIRSLLFDTSPLDVPTFAGVGLILVAVAVLAAWIPSRRAARADPVRAMRAD